MIDSSLTKQRNRLICVAAIMGILAVLLGAFGAHTLKAYLSDAALNQYRTGVTYQFYHLGAILFGSLSLEFAPKPTLLLVALWGFVLGVVLFSGSLVLLAITGIRAFGLMTPLGGVVLLASWAVLIVVFINNKRV